LCGTRRFFEFNPSKRSRSRRRGGTWAFALAFLLHGSAGLAQDDVKAGLETWQNSGCADCHGPFADGNRDYDDYPQGANLRTTRLDAAAIEMTIRCGRPGTGMPSFDAGAYTDRACYGRPLGVRPDDLQPTPRSPNPDEISALIAYLKMRIVGHGKVTRQEAYPTTMASPIATISNNRSRRACSKRLSNKSAARGPSPRPRPITWSRKQEFRHSPRLAGAASPQRACSTPARIVQSAQRSPIGRSRSSHKDRGSFAERPR